jgi:hypothetical protein
MLPARARADRSDSGRSTARPPVTRSCSTARSTTTRSCAPYWPPTTAPGSAPAATPKPSSPLPPLGPGGGGPAAQDVRLPDLGPPRAGAVRCLADDPDVPALQHYLQPQYVPEPATLHRAIRRVGSGTHLTVRPGGEVEQERYFTVGAFLSGGCSSSSGSGRASPRPPTRSASGPAAAGTAARPPARPGSPRPASGAAGRRAAPRSWARCRAGPRSRAG